jgi:hypothetical protein
MATWQHGKIVLMIVSIVGSRGKPFDGVPAGRFKLIERCELLVGGVGNNPLVRLIERGEILVDYHTAEWELQFLKFKAGDRR